MRRDDLFEAEALLEADIDDDELPRPETAEAAGVLAFAAARCDEGESVRIATVLARRGSAPSTPGQKLALTASGVAFGTIGGGALERSVLRRLVALGTTSQERPFRIESYKLGQSFGMCCGGGVDVLYESLLGPEPVLIVGAGHVSQATAPLLAASGFAVTVVDERDEWIARFAKTSRLVAHAGDFRGVGRSMPKRAYVLAMTHDHVLDQDVVEWALRERFAFVGGVGSRAKAVRAKERLSTKGFAGDDLARIRMPVGLDIGSRTPAEIAVSIAAELIAHRRRTEEAP
jgi:xanthine dehydrogenase accessory factor